MDDLRLRCGEGVDTWSCLGEPWLRRKYRGPPLAEELFIGKPRLVGGRAAWPRRVGEGDGDGDEDARAL
jgi:hypothetical protein